MKRNRSISSASTSIFVWRIIVLLQISLLQRKTVQSYCPTTLQYQQSNSYSHLKRKESAFLPSNYLIRCNNKYESKNIILYMGKGDGKKKRKKKPSTTQISSSASSVVSEPRRVSTHINIPIRRQIKWGQINKAIERQSTPSFRALNVKRTKYRKSIDEEEEEAAKLIRSNRGKEPNWDIILNATSSSPLVIIDAYNVMHKHSKLKKYMNKGLLSKARDSLIYDLEELRTLKGWRIEIVFDGMKKINAGPLGLNAESIRKKSVTQDNSNNNHEQQISQSAQQATKKVTNHGVRVVFSGVGTSADAYIESRCYDAKQKTHGKYTNSLIVASDDGMIRSAASNAGAYIMSSQRIVDEIKSLKKMISYKVEVAVARNNGHEVRPESLRNNGVLNTRRGTGQFLIVDKRKKKKIVEKNSDGGGCHNTKPKDVKEIMDGTTTKPSWAMLPNQIPKNGL